MTTTGLYNEVVTITYDYLGPAADRFVVRQIRNHLEKNPEELERKDLRQLMDWIRLAMRVISNDTDTIDKYMADLEVLARANHKRLTPTHGKQSL